MEAKKGTHRVRVTQILGQQGLAQDLSMIGHPTSSAWKQPIDRSCGKSGLVENVAFFYAISKDKITLT